MKLVFLVHLAATLYMTGVIWFVQVVHYPLFNRISAQSFAGYGAANGRLTTWVVMPQMLIELLTAVLLIWRRPAEISGAALSVNLALLVIIWLSTWLLQVPRHQALGSGFVAATHDSLVLTNWVRTIAWSARSVIVLWIAERMIN